mgnify:CR=1 FL=1
MFLEKEKNVKYLYFGKKLQHISFIHESTHLPTFLNINDHISLARSVSGEPMEFVDYNINEIIYNRV